MSKKEKLDKIVISIFKTDIPKPEFKRELYIPVNPVIPFERVEIKSPRVFIRIHELISKDLDILVEKGYAGLRTRYIIYVSWEFYSTWENMRFHPSRETSILEDLLVYLNSYKMEGEVIRTSAKIMGVLIIRTLPYLEFVGKCFDEMNLKELKKDAKG